MKKAIAIILTIVTACLLPVSCQRNAAAEKTTAMAALRDVLLSKQDFYSTDEGQNRRVNEFCYLNGKTLDAPLDVLGLIVVDMDEDGIPEAVLEMTDHAMADYEVLHYNAGNGRVDGFWFAFSALDRLKTDGTFSFTNGDVDFGHGRLRFDGSACYTDKLAYSETVYDAEHNQQTTYYVGGKKVSKDDFYAFNDKQVPKPYAPWEKLDEESINAALSLDG